MILGTAGHVDHGKTALVKALTGVDTDRLAEEKRRGITIDLGFAPLALANGIVVGIVDVPGHEAFVRNMLAGATGIDLALLVVAADEGVMPQTREHLAILTLLGIRGGIIALTKSDLVDAEWLDLVTADVRAAVADTALAHAPIVVTSVTTGGGIDMLRAAIARAAHDLPGRDANDLFRLPIDRAFTVRGTGTVVTGTVWTGRLASDATVRLLPGGKIARVRGIESHGRRIDAALPGTRAAIALTGIEISDVGRGTVLVTDAGWAETRTLLAHVALLPSAPHPLGARTRVRFHLGTHEVGARVVSAGGALAPGSRKQVRIALDEPVAARAGDRFVLRSASPVVTIGGGAIDDPQPPHRRARPWVLPAASAAERLERILAASGTRGVLVSTLAVRLGASPSDVAGIIAQSDAPRRRVGDRLYGLGAIDEIRRRLGALVTDAHAATPLEPGVSLQSVRARLAVDPSVADSVLHDAVGAQELELCGGLVLRHGWTPRLSEAQVGCRSAILAALRAAGREPPSVSEMQQLFGPDTSALLRNLERSADVVQVEPDRYYAREVVDEMVSDLRKGMTPGAEYGPADIKEILESSRKYLIPFLEFCDRQGVTERHPRGRVLSVSTGERSGA